MNLSDSIWRSKEKTIKLSCEIYTICTLGTVLLEFNWIWHWFLTTYINLVNVSSSAVVWFLENPTENSLVFFATQLVGWFLAPPLGYLVTSGRCSDLMDSSWHWQMSSCCSAQNNNDCKIFYSLGFLSAGMCALLLWYKVPILCTWGRNWVHWVSQPTACRSHYELK